MIIIMDHKETQLIRPARRSKRAATEQEHLLCYSHWEPQSLPQVKQEILCDNLSNFSSIFWRFCCNIIVLVVLKSSNYVNTSLVLACYHIRLRETTLTVAIFWRWLNLHPTCAAVWFISRYPGAPISLLIITILLQGRYAITSALYFY